MNYLFVLLTLNVVKNYVFTIIWLKQILLFFCKRKCFSKILNKPNIYRKLIIKFSKYINNNMQRSIKYLQLHHVKLVETYGIHVCYLQFLSLLFFVPYLFVATCLHFSTSNIFLECIRYVFDCSALQCIFYSLKGTTLRFGRVTQLKRFFFWKPIFSCNQRIYCFKTHLWYLNMSFYRFWQLCLKLECICWTGKSVTNALMRSSDIIQVFTNQ